jgi:radical SAM-linked protein
MTVFERAFLRAGYAARFTEGYNPKPRLEFANPLSLGLESEEEIAGIDLHDFDSETSFVRRMNGGLPPGLSVTRVSAVANDGVARRRSLMSLYWGADFEIADASGEHRLLRLPASGPSIRKTLEADGTWDTAVARRTATWAAGAHGEAVSYFEAFRAPPSPSDGSLALT